MLESKKMTAIMVPVAISVDPKDGKLCLLSDKGEGCSGLIVDADQNYVCRVFHAEGVLHSDDYKSDLFTPSGKSADVQDLSVVRCDNCLYGIRV